MTSPASEIYPFGLLVKSWATGLDYFTTSFPTAPTAPPTTPIAGGTPWALPQMSSLFVPIAGSATPATVSAVAMTWDNFASLLHHADAKVSLGDITNPTGAAANVVVVQGDSNTWVLRLPSKLILQQFEKAHLSGVTPYTIPSFYDALYTAAGWTPSTTPVVPSGKDAILKLDANRIGDYAMGNCDR
jgi:hypothetical protein